MIELERSNFFLAYPLFQPTRYGVLAAGTLEGGHPGRVFCDKQTDPSAALVCTQVGYYFLAGSPGSTKFTADLLDTFDTDLSPNQMAKIGDPQMLLFYDHPGWKEPLLSIFNHHKPIEIHKKRMVLGPDAAAALRGWQERVPAGLRVVPVTADLLQIHPDKKGEVELFWGSVDAFLQKSLGLWILEGDTLLSSVEAVFTGGGEAEISIATVPSARRRGLAAIAASAFIEASLSRALNPIWGCWPENEPSVALAKHLGFVEDLNQPVIYWEWNENPSQ
jgi:RimJ/RimL family protein N-acetyltransferase